MNDAWGRESTNYQCRHCGTYAQGEVLGTHYWADEDERTGWQGPAYRYRFVKCTRCNDASLLISMEVSPDTYDDEVSLYPGTPRALGNAVPDSLRTCFGEARTCLTARAYTAAAIMYRRSLELLAIERGIKAKNLASALLELRDGHHIDDRLYNWADELRLAGNEAAHEVHTGVTAEDAQDMNDLAEAIIDYVYVFQERYEAFKARRGQSTQRPARTSDLG